MTSCVVVTEVCYNLPFSLSNGHFIAMSAGSFVHSDIGQLGPWLILEKFYISFPATRNEVKLCFHSLHASEGEIWSTSNVIFLSVVAVNLEEVKKRNR